jgi:hypothetical protein
VDEWEDAPDWLLQAIEAQGGFTAADWQEWETLRRRLRELDLVFEPASSERPVRNVAAYRGGRWVAGVTVRWSEDTRPIMPALRELLGKAVA